MWGPRALLEGAPFRSPTRDGAARTLWRLPARPRGRSARSPKTSGVPSRACEPAPPSRRRGRSATRNDRLGVGRDPGAAAAERPAGTASSGGSLAHRRRSASLAVGIAGRGLVQLRPHGRVEGTGPTLASAAGCERLLTCRSVRGLPVRAPWGRCCRGPRSRGWIDD